MNDSLSRLENGCMLNSVIHGTKEKTFITGISIKTKKKKKGGKTTNKPAHGSRQMAWPSTKKV